MVNLTRGEAEAQITQAMVKFEREYKGRGPEEAKTFIIEEHVFVRLRGVLTPAERHLAKADDTITGRKLIKQVRQELIENARYLLETIVKDVLGIDVVSLHTDISSVTGERIIVFTMERSPRFMNE
ncbi:DUF2294 domain-containing protein [Chitinispirillales bacterium ANBcel5]|uniref:DUF2294 domain-containing protein n=1 Tax=Cellulosispirillum alkaliphilum TaxID=3039283 RepID=UPI002A4EA246|nr:DUF2294 domain-containing protein [Chitinispirillales bacterium ANBcel5]